MTKDLRSPGISAAALRRRLFFFQALTWLRQQREFRTTIRPDDRLDGEAVGVARVAGYFPRPSSASRWAYFALCALAIGALLTLINLPGMGPTQRAGAVRAGWALEGLALGALVIAEARRRIDRSPALVELRSRGVPPTRKTLAKLAARGSGRTIWLVSEAGVPPEALADAAAHGILCFAGRGADFVAIEPSRRPPNHHRAA